jgi:RimJ/RimL family protein N-acetyltransferase
MLKGDRVILRAMRREDLERYNELKNDIEIELLASDDPPAPMELARTQLNFEDHIRLDRQDHVWFAIETQTKFIGQCILHRFDHAARTCALGITIGDRDYWGKGYGRDAVNLLLKYAFRLRNLEKVWLSVSGTNVRAQRSYASCGFVEEGRLKRQIWLDGDYDDLVYMGLLRDDWLASQDAGKEVRLAADEG